MKSTRLVLVSIAIVLILLSCQKGPQKPAEASANAANAKSGFVIIAGLGLADIAEGKAKFVDSLTLGEKVALTGLAGKGTGSDGKERDFVQVKRDSGSTGWARTEYVVPNCFLGVVTADESIVYSEPKNTAATARSILKTTVLAVHAESAGQPLLKVTAYDPAANLFHKDVYLRGEDVSSKPDDVQGAILLQLAGATKNPKQKEAFLKSAARDHPGSLFIAQIEESLAALSAPPPAKATEKFFATMAATDDAVNVRDAPDEKSGKVVGTLAKAQKVDVQEQTTESFTVGDKTAPWYKISEPAGWVFGAWLAPEE